MKKLLLIAALGLVSLGGAQMNIVGQRKVSADTLKWGTSATGRGGNLMARAAAIYRDSSGAYVRIDNQADSCSQPIAIEKGGVYGIWSKEFRYSVRATAVDSAILKFNIHTRYCADARESKGCEAWVFAGKHIGDGNVTIKDTLRTVAPTATTIERQSNSVQVTGSQIRVCPVISLIGGQTGDSTFFSSIIFRGQ